MDRDCQELHNKENVDLDGTCKSILGVGVMDIDEHYNRKKLSANSLLVKNIGKVVQDLRSLGFTSMTEDAYASAIFLLLKVSTCH
ncbi:Anaphase-promoting complex subunit 2 [Bienertia sinuspersici]